MWRCWFRVTSAIMIVVQVIGSFNMLRGCIRILRTWDELAGRPMPMDCGDNYFCTVTAFSSTFSSVWVFNTVFNIWTDLLTDHALITVRIGYDKVHSPRAL